MEPFNIEQQRIERARKRVKSIAGFYKHLIAYVLVNIVLIGIKFYSIDGSEVFFSFDTFATAIFWGIGLAFHALGVFSENVIFGSRWEERKVRELMEKDKQKRWE